MRKRYTVDADTKKIYYQANRVEIASKRKAKSYGVSAEQFNQMMNEQKGHCKICKTLMFKPCIDHCHASGRVRGLLCGRCNSGLGYFQDDTVLLLAAVEYLS